MFNSKIYAIRHAVDANWKTSLTKTRLVPCGACYGTRGAWTWSSSGMIDRFLQVLLKLVTGILSNAAVSGMWGRVGSVFRANPVREKPAHQSSNAHYRPVAVEEATDYACNLYSMNRTCYSIPHFWSGNPKGRQNWQLVMV